MPNDSVPDDFWIGQTGSFAHSLSDAPGAYGTAFWAAAGLTALAIIPSLILVRAERAARQRGAPDVPDEILAEAVAA